MLNSNSLLRSHYWKICFLTYQLPNVIGFTEDLPYHQNAADNFDISQSISEFEAENFQELENLKLNLRENENYSEFKLTNTWNVITYN